MAKILSAREAKLQKKLIPLNIFVFLLCIVAAVSLFFAPILKIDIGKILGSEAMEEQVEKTLDETVGKNLEGTSQEGVNFAPVITTVVKNVLGDVKGSLSVTAYDAYKVAIAPENNKAKIVMDAFFFGENGLITELLDSVIKGLFSIFETPEGKTLVEEAVVSALTATIISGLPPEAAAKFDSEKTAELANTFRKMDTVRSEAEAVEVVDEFLDGIGETIGEDFTDSDRETVSKYVMDMYNDTVTAVDGNEEQEFSLEAMICVAISKDVNLQNMNIGGVIGGLVNNGETSDSRSLKVAEGEADATTPPESGEGTENGGTDESGEGTTEPPAEPSEGGDTTGTPEGEIPPEEQTPAADDKVVCTSYTQLLKEMGFDNEEAENLSASLTAAVEEQLDGTLGKYSTYFGYYGYLFYGMLVFIGLWLLLALTSFIRIFTKNKRFSMWYVKLLCFIPSLIYVALFAAKLIITKNLIPGIANSLGDNSALIMGALDGITSFTWINGLCYLLLWLFSIFWAFPIKHRIRKERKMCKEAKKNGTYSYDEYKEDLGYAVTDDDSYGYGGTDDYDGGYDDYDEPADYDYSYDDDGFDDY